MNFSTSLYLLLLNKIILLEWDLIIIISTPISVYLYFDPLGLILSAVVLFISGNIINFSKFYIRDETHLKRFIHLVLLFVLSINILIFIPHFIFLLLGWDGLGLTSFLLVIYYYSPKALGAGIITALTNRIGDVLILVSIGGFLTLGHWNIMLSWEIINNKMFILFILIASITKRAQIPFSSWLPAAIAAPTPVSALVHSSTLVTAGVFLLIRFYQFLRQTPIFFKTLIITAVATMVIAGIVAIIETDLKKIIALSTLRQLGVIISSIALGMPILALFHLITHALFKALLFMCAGRLIHLNNHNQDLRIVGNIINQIPLTRAAFLISNIALCGLPFLAGFYSKDLILEYSMFININLLIIIIIAVGTGLTAIYSIRFLLIGWTRQTQSFTLHTIKDRNISRLNPETLLALGALIGGRAINWLIITPLNTPAIKRIYKITPIITIMLSFIVVTIYLLNLKTINIKKRVTIITLSTIWFLAPLSSQRLIKYSMVFAIQLTKNIDQGWNEYVGGEGIKKITINITKEANMFQRNMPTIHLTLAALILLPIVLLT